MIVLRRAPPAMEFVEAELAGGGHLGETCGDIAVRNELAQLEGEVLELGAAERAIVVPIKDVEDLLQPG